MPHGTKLYTAPRPSAVPAASGLDADDVRAACQNAIEVFAEVENAEQCREVAEYMREVLLVDLERAAPCAPSAPATGIADASLQGVNAQLLEALENTATWIEQLPVPTVGAAGQLVKIDKAIAAARKEGGKV